MGTTAKGMPNAPVENKESWNTEDTEGNRGHRELPYLLIGLPQPDKITTNGTNTPPGRR